VQPYHHWYIAFRHTEEDLQRALDVVEEALAYVAEQYPWQR
jgi:glutamate-1-semialdehyde 2,1-aminomutase/spore coat polysaccharide biosynthesis protein SpsF